MSDLGDVVALLQSVLVERTVCEALDGCFERSVTVRFLVEFDPGVGDEVVAVRALCLGHALLEDAVVKLQDSGGS